MAITTLTIVPLRPGRVDRRTAAQAMAWTPVVGLVLGVAAAAVLYGMRRLGPYWLPYNGAVVTVIFLALATRGMHLDGLADTFDGLGSMKSRSQRLAAMRRSGVGAMGVAALVLVLIADTVTIAVCVSLEHGTAAIVSSVVAGRVAILLGARVGVTAARRDGMGAMVAETVRVPTWVGWCLALLAATALFGSWHDHESIGLALRAALAVALGLGAAELLRWIAVRRFGGITGDLLGAMTEVATTVCLIAFSTIPNP